MDAYGTVFGTLRLRLARIQIVDYLSIRIKREGTHHIRRYESGVKVNSPNAPPYLRLLSSFRLLDEADRFVYTTN